jgi:hypothetical protein
MGELKVLHPRDIEPLSMEWRREAVRALIAIRVNPKQPPGFDVKVLERQEMMRGDLSGLYSVRFGSGSDYDQSYRIVYRIDDLNDIEVLAIGNRQGSAVFKMVRDRLYPKPRRRVRGAR